MALRVKQDVLGLEVAVHDIERVQVAQSTGDLRRVETRARLQEAPLPLQVVEQLEVERNKERENGRERD